ncbi:MAG: epoxyqueuosine reductase QueH, partial [Rhodospirillales bacterium]|nr:epoxyqueuosine reductase QueH [Rhodospirillales bacterium]
KYASENGYDIVSSTLGISRWKDMKQINASGSRSAALYKIPYWDFNWRKKGGSSRMLELSKKEGFYQQEYCGCAYSLRDTNQSRVKRGLAPIKLGVKFYDDDAAD